jgi:hypothetical protein
MVIFSGLALNAQASPEPPGNAGSGVGPVGGSAPIGSCISILLAMSAAYGGKKVYDFRKKMPLS